ncbi:MAG: aspartate--tRNA(Asn) ligase [Anaerolineae bacterium]|jgi:nondiscriminating aspartyl-tRNA synthetase|nr:aspartate--tRNA(Asn) ligase [Anaerolineae bacterium]
MVSRIYTTQLSAHVGERVQIAGWKHRLRRLSGISFLIVRDKHGLAQVVIEDDTISTELDRLYQESVIRVEGIAIATPQAPSGVELHHPQITVITPAHEPPPFDLFRPSLTAQPATLLDHAALTLRHPQRRHYWQIAAASLCGFRSALDHCGFTEIQTPKLVASATESGANVFSVDYFGQTAYLAQSPQFYKQIMVGVLERVYEVGRVFRAEPHDTPRHLNEYTSLDVEMGFINDHHTVIALLTEVLQQMLEVIAPLMPELPRLPQRLPVIHFQEALELIYQQTGEDARHEPDLAPAHERWLGEWARAEYGSDFLAVEGYPMIKRPFYTHPNPMRPAYSNSFDLLFRGLELVTGGQRLHRYPDYLAALASRGLNPDPFEGYLQAFKYGMPPHGGFAIGLERWVARLCEVANVREVALFPRDLNRLTP